MEAKSPKTGIQLMKKVILFDLGNTLAQYYERTEFPGILKQAITGVQDYLRDERLLKASPESVWLRVKEEDHESKDYSVRPLEERLARIFQLDNSSVKPDKLMEAICRRFLKPIFALGCCYDDTLPVLQELGKRGVKKAIVSNTPWGSPANLWREEIKRLGLYNQVENVVFCRDAGWRKPARQIFDFTLEKLGISSQECVFVGDDPRWDIAGPRTVGIEAILIDRRGIMQDAGEKTIRTLYELLD